MNDEPLIQVIELGVKPQDFFQTDNQKERGRREFDNYHLNSRRKIDNYCLDNKQMRSAYLAWYPLIAACSFIRTNKSDPFAAEYIIPQLLMQWVRFETDRRRKGEEHRRKKLIDIRDFSCASMRASDMGFNYVFPTSGKQDTKIPFCPTLLDSFTLTKPRYLHDYPNVCSCECALLGDLSLKRADA